MMYVLSLIVFVIVLSFNLSLTNIPFLYMFDFISILMVPLLVLPILIASGTEKDLLRALRFTVRKSSFLSIRDLKRCEEAVSLTIRLLLYTGSLLFFIQGSGILSNVDPSMQNFGRILSLNFTVAALSLIYPLLLCCLLLPIRSKIRCKLIDMESPCHSIISEEN